MTAALAVAAPVGLVDTFISQRFEPFPAPKKPRKLFDMRARRRLARCRRRARRAGALPAELAVMVRPRKEQPWPAANVNVIAEAYPVDVKIKVRGLGGVGGSRPGRRGLVTRFTPTAARRLKFFARNTRDLWKGFVTLTYPGVYPRDGREVKRHINAFCQFLRRRKIAYLWVLEFQQRGAPHFHLLVSGWLPKWELSLAWYRIAGGGDERHLSFGTQVKAITDADAVGAYVADYAGKLEQKEVPEEYKNVGRFWGASRVLKKTLFRMDALYREAARALRPARAYYGASCRGWGFKWRWAGRGFILREGADWFKDLLRQAVKIDEGVDLWREWDGESKPGFPYVRVGDNAQLLLAGRCGRGAGSLRHVDPAGGQYRRIEEYRADRKATDEEAN